MPMFKRGGVVLFLISVSACGGGNSTPTAPSLASTLAGSWHNVDSNTQSVSRAMFQVSANMLTVEMWGRCQPVECDWGQVSVPLSSVVGTFSVVWTNFPGGLTQTEQITLMANGQLQALGVASQRGINISTTDYLAKD